MRCILPRIPIWGSIETTTWRWRAMRMLGQTFPGFLSGAPLKQQRRYEPVDTHDDLPRIPIWGSIETAIFRASCLFGNTFPGFLSGAPLKRTPLRRLRRTRSSLLPRIPIWGSIETPNLVDNFNLVFNPRTRLPRIPIWGSIETSRRAQSCVLCCSSFPGFLSGAPLKRSDSYLGLH